MIQLQEEFHSFVGDNLPFAGMATISPHGGMASLSSLRRLHDTLSLQGYMHNVYSQIEIFLEHSWILNYPVSCLAVSSKGVQSSVLAILAGTEMCGDDLVAAIQDKLK